MLTITNCWDQFLLKFLNPYIRELLIFLEVRTKEKFITVAKNARIFPNLLRALDVSNFEIEIEFYDLENNLDVKTFF